MSSSPIKSVEMSRDWCKKKKIEEQFTEDFKVLNNYALELKTTNHRNSVTIVAERANPNEVPMFQKMYICLATIREGFFAG